MNIEAGRKLEDVLDELVAADVAPTLHYKTSDQRWTEDDDPLWCCHEAKDEANHFHGRTALEAATGLLLNKPL